MKKTILFLFLFFNGCSFNHYFVENKINKVTIVQYTSYMKEHRAYFARKQLKAIKDGNKYLYFYHVKRKHLAILLREKDQYVLYNMSNPKQKPLVLNVRHNTKYKYVKVLKFLKNKGFKRPVSLASLGYITSVSYKKYKGVKTLLVETKNYSRLQRLYKEAIQKYDSRGIQNIKTKLPKILIFPYYQKYKKDAKLLKQLEQLKIIATKLNLQAPKIPNKLIKKQKKSTPVTNKTTIESLGVPKIVIQNEVQQVKEDIKDESTQVEIKQEMSIVPMVTEVSHSHVSNDKPYSYYLKEASLKELSTYISRKTTKSLLSYSLYDMLSRRQVVLREEEVLKNGSLDELIARYKVNKNPKYKERIMSLMKDKQVHH
ncbi:MAG: hypothetical protein U9N11_08315 [Campylobacterota bacterium]|nr:hypothetical protein [Campylobacterota bacterium]